MPPKGHHGSAGIIGVFLTGEDVDRLHRLAQHLGLTDQDVARAVLHKVLEEWDQQIMEIERTDQ